MGVSGKEREGRLRRFRELLAEEELDGFIVTSPENRRYLSGFTGSSGVLLVALEWAVLLTDFRYLEQAATETAGTGIDLQKQAKKIWESVAKLLRARTGPLARWGFESDHLVEGDYRFLAGQVGPDRLAPKEGFPGRLRMVKSPAEIGLIAKATAITDRAWERLLPEIKPGRREEELAALFEFFQREEGASAASFPTLVASGPRSAMPHGAAGSRPLCPGDLVVVDGGAVYAGYCSDFTRTVVVGEEPGAEQKRIYRLVLEAQERALAGLKPGMTAAEADALAREVLEKAGYGPNFGHGLGHGLGLAIHEAPRLSPGRETVLEPGMVVTVEPGIYLPDWGGVRIEDVVVITEEGCRVLTRSPKTPFPVTP
ncbi:MAG TPA: aminopeptidase P family protein [Firmicutes bacterium]|mgnify:CR=1 FL=1|jgi:Xaa-Pro aminopeptidase|nr:aminopeptidase P family protein [Bacillota bacterium]